MAEEKKKKEKKKYLMDGTAKCHECKKRVVPFAIEQTEKDGVEGFSLWTHQAGCTIEGQFAPHFIFVVATCRKCNGHKD